MKTLNVRLPDDLHRFATARAERLGVSLNAVICVALDAYLLGSEKARQEAAQPATAPPAVDPRQGVISYPDEPLSRQQRRALERQGRK